MRKIKIISPNTIGEQKSVDIAGEDELAELDKQHIANTKTITHWIKIGALGTCAFLAFAIVVVYTLHLLIPEGGRWLDAEDLQHIEKAGLTIIVGVVSTLATGYFLTSHN